jgi:hypothetical protein
MRVAAVRWRQVRLRQRHFLAGLMWALRQGADGYADSCMLVIRGAEVESVIRGGRFLAWRRDGELIGDGVRVWGS